MEDDEYTKNLVREVLKNELAISVSRRGEWYTDQVHVELKLSGETISKDYFTLESDS